VRLDLDGTAAPPRRNGELVFDAPWQGRVFGLAAGVVERRFDGDWAPFRRCLVDAIADRPERAYWDSWTAALEELVVGAGLLGRDAVARRIAD
jgi:Nitrile hydratase beta subunit